MVLELKLPRWELGPFSSIILHSQQCGVCIALRLSDRDSKMGTGGGRNERTASVDGVVFICPLLVESLNV